MPRTFTRDAAPNFFTWITTEANELGTHARVVAHWSTRERAEWAANALPTGGFEGQVETSRYPIGFIFPITDDLPNWYEFTMPAPSERLKECRCNGTGHRVQWKDREGKWRASYQQETIEAAKTHLRSIGVLA